MRYVHLFIIIILIVVLPSCNNKVVSTNDAIIGTWRAYGIVGDGGEVVSYESSFSGEELKTLTNAYYSFSANGEVKLKSRIGMDKATFTKENGYYKIMFNNYNGPDMTLKCHTKNKYLFLERVNKDPDEVPMVYVKIKE